jgi:CDP-glucose 4,6-dehydratase
VTAAFRRSFYARPGVAVASARAGNVVGGGDWSEDRLVADLMRAAAEGRAVTVRNPDSVRPWQHVLEPLRGYLMLGRALVERGADVGEGWNFGPALDDAVTVRELVDRFAEVWPRVVVEMAAQSSGPHEAAVLRLDNTKARERLGWAPILTLGETVRYTVDWYRAVHEDPAGAARMVDRQLTDYEHRLRDAGMDS